MRRASRNGSGQRIATVRRTLRLTQGAFAARLGVTRNTVMKYEGGAVPRVEILDRIARAGGVTAEWILRGPRAVSSRALQTEWEFDEAVSLLRTLWAELSRRVAIIGVLRALQPS